MRSNLYKTIRNISIVVIVCITALLSASCGGPAEITFAVKHLIDRPGEKITEVQSADTNAGFDNTSGTAPLQVQVQLQRPYKNQITVQLSNDQVSGKGVRDKIIELYKLSPMDPEGTQYKALCPISVVIPAGMKSAITAEWTERWAEGVINEGTEGAGKQLGAYKVFLGYFEPCSLIKQENKN